MVATNSPYEPRRATSSRELILSAAMQCFEQHGLRSTRVEDVLQEAGVSRGTFYRHFSGIDGVTVELAVRAARDLFAAAINESAGAEMPVTARVALVVARISGRNFDPPILKMIEESSDLMRLSNMVVSTDNARQLVASPLLPLLQVGQRDGSFRADLSAEQMAEWLVRNASSVRQLPPPWSNNPADVLAYVTDFVMPALLAYRDKGMEDVSARLSRIEQQLAINAIEPR
ncbi:Transcriptional regulator, TetR family [Pseudomonas sp. 9AZ]|uniref:TetR/AcrR family transcriptional regulator n=1 Tax=Pseudomonas sp. 9AZ TaxID=2653168 RepID=UPI0012EEEA5D|nr:TetR/AcrR family transcriptional regulator [Pseudomonas sp. 9AZ]VXD04259.1 Transcriptional regulator, TetR family [Pseudomonas sp. 9AZ]